MEPILKQFRQFTSDNRSGIAPEPREALARANVGRTPSHENDPWTRLASDKIRQTFETDCDVYFAAPETAANAIALAAFSQIGELCETARSCGLRVHTDGTRFANGVAFLDYSPADLTWRAGVDVLCLGGTKCGMLGGEVLLVL